MTAFEIKPLQGVGPIRFGMSREEVHDQLGQPEHERDDREWFLRGFAVDFDSTGRVEFLEAARSASVRVLFQGQCLLEMSADDAVRHVSRFAAFDADDWELGHSYMFPELQLSLWRPTMSQPDQPADDTEGGFHAVGAAAAGYFDS